MDHSPGWGGNGLVQDSADMPGLIWFADNPGEWNTGGIAGLITVTRDFGVSFDPDDIRAGAGADPVPEPVTGMWLATALVSLAWIRRKSWA